MVFEQNVSRTRGLEKTGSFYLVWHMQRHTFLSIHISKSFIFCCRWAFIDLSAGPFSWGPAVGGEGVRTEASLPNVERTTGSASGSNDVFDFGCVHASLIYR